MYNWVRVTQSTVTQEELHSPGQGAPKNQPRDLHVIKEVGIRDTSYQVPISEISNGNSHKDLPPTHELQGIKDLYQNFGLQEMGSGELDFF